MRRVHWMSLLAVAVAIGLWGAPGWAAPGPIRVALVVHAQGPMAEDSAVVQAILGNVSRGLESIERVQLISQERVRTAQRALGFELSADRSARQVHAFAAAVGADTVVLIQISLEEGRFIVLHGFVFKADGGVLLESRSALFRPDMEEQVQGAVKEFLEKIVPVLLKL